MTGLPHDPYAAIVEHGGLNASDVGVTRRFAGGKEQTSKALTDTAEVLIPQPGARLTLYWIAVYASEKNTSEVLCEVLVGTQVAYTFYLTNPGAFMHWEPVEGDIGDAVTVKLSAPAKVAVSMTYTEGLPEESSPAESLYPSDVLYPSDELIPV